MESDNSSPVRVASENIISVTMQQGFQSIVVETTIGLVLGGLAGIVLVRGGGSAAARKSITGFGAGIGLGSAWTRTSMNLEEMIASAASFEATKK